MAVTWGTMQTGGGNGMAVGLEPHSGSSPSTSSTTWTWLCNAWTKNQYNYSGDTQTITYGGSQGGSTAYTNSEPTGSSSQRATNMAGSYTYPASSYGVSPGNLTLTASVSGYYNTAMPAPTCSVAITVPARPYAAPNPPTSVTNTRNSDTKSTVTWANPATAQKPVTNFTLQTSTYTGATWSAWVSSSATTATSLAITTSANHIYKFQVRTNNSIGSSAFVAANVYSYTTPATPTNVVATLSGSDIVVTWKSTAYTSSLTTHKIERQKDGGAWTSVKTGIAQGTLTWTDVAPTGSTNNYRVATVNTGSGTLTSAWGTAGVVELWDAEVYDGADVIPANLFMWNGSAEVPLKIDPAVVFKR